MTTLNLPNWFDVLECEMSLVPEVRGFSGPFGGPTEVQDLLGDRWRMRLTLPDGDFNWGGRTEALFNRLRGGADWLRLHHFAKPVPRGTARGSLVLASAAAQGAQQLAISGSINSNQLNSGSFEIDSNGDGLADNWTRYSAGTFGALNASRSGGLSFHGAWSQFLGAASLGSTSSDRQGITRSGVNIQALAGLNACFCATVLGTLNSSVHLELAWRDGGGSIISSIVSGPVSLTTGVQLIGATGLCPPNAVTCIIYIYQAGNTGASPGFYVDGAQIIPGSLPQPFVGFPTLLAGDMLGHNGEQLFQVYEDATANDAGAITVTTVNRAREAIASAQAIVWDKPAIPFQLLDANGVPTAYTRGRARGQQVDFIEAWT